MDVIKLKGDIESEQLIIKESIDDSLFVYESSEMRIYEYIDKLDLDGEYYKLKICYEVEFNGYLKIKNNNKISKHNVNNISDVLKKMNYDKHQSYNLIIFTQDKNIIGNIIQQFIYLGVEIDILSEKDEIDKKIILKYRNELEKLKNEVSDSINEISLVDVDYRLLEDKDGIIQLLENIRKNLIDSSDRELTISVMATKKAGKSVVVNSFLGEEYAPTSLELPTPNSCIYKRNKDNSLVLNYDDNEIKYDTTQDLRRFILDEFTRAQKKVKGCNINDMEILYPNKNNLANFSNYTIVDTPGPDFAGADHKEIAKKWIEKSDVVLFVVDYGKHLTDTEEKYLQDIKTYFEKYDKFYSFIVVVNKMDLMYLDGSSKQSSTRFLDYLRFKLNNIGYEGFFMFGVSALDYFNSKKILTIEGCEELNTDDLDKFNNCLVNARRKYQGKEEINIISYINNQISRLGDFHGIWDSNLETIIEHSGMERLINFTNYIAEDKAIYEMIKAALFRIDQDYSVLKNKFILEQLNKLESQKSEIDELIGNLIAKIDNFISDLENHKSDETLKNHVNKDIKNISQNIENMLKEQSAIKIKKHKESIIENSSNQEELENLFTNSIIIEFDILNVQKEAEMDLKNINSRIQEGIEKFELSLFKKNNELQELIIDFNQKLKKDYKMNELEIILPKLSMNFDKKDIAFNNIEREDISEKIKESITRSSNIFEKISNWFKRKGFKGNYTIDMRELNEKFKEIEKSIHENISVSCKKIEYDLKHEFIKLNEQVNDDFSLQSNKIFENYKTILRNIRVDLNLDKENMELKINFLNKVQEIFDDFDKLWDLIREEGDNDDI